MSLPEISIKRPVFATVSLLALILLGIVSYFRMSVDEMPDVSFPYVSVSIMYEGAQPEQIDTQVTKKVEEAVGEAKGVKHIYSISREGEAEIGVEFNLDVDPAMATQDVRDKVSAIRSELPDNIKEPVIARFDMKAAPVITVALTSETASLRELSILVEDVLKPRLQKIGGVGQLQISGLQKREIQLLLDRDKVAALGFSVPEISQRLQQENQDIPAGKLTEPSQELSVRTAGNFIVPEDFLSVVIGIRNGAQVYYRQIGTVQDTIKDLDAIARYDDQQAISLEIGKQSGANAVNVAKQVKAELEKIRQTLPPGITLHLVRDDAQRVEDSIHEVWYDLIIGGFFAVIIVLWFLGDWRSTVISALTIPASIVATFFFMKLANFSINSMSLLGLSLSVGLLIDDAIVVIENIIRHRQMGKPAIEAAAEGTREIALAVMATTFTVVAVFVPVGFMSGVVGQFFKEFGLTIAFAVLVSLFIAFTLTPMMAALYLPVGQHHTSGRLGQWWSKWNCWFDRLADVYAELLRKLLHKHRSKVLIASLALFVLSLLLFPYLGSSFIPNTDQSQFTVKVKTQAGPTVEALDYSTRKMLQEIRSLPEIQHIYSTSSSRDQVLFITLVPKKERQRTQADVISEVRSKLNRLPGVRVDIEQGDSKPVTVSITGDSMETLGEIAEQMQRKMEAIPGVQDIVSTYRPGMPNLNITIKQEQANDLAVSTTTIGNTLQTLLNGTVIGKYSDSDERVDIRARLASMDRSRPESLTNIYVPSEKTKTDGQKLLIPLPQVTEWHYTTSPAEIGRFDRQKEIRLTANLEKTTLGDFNNRFYPSVEDIPMPVGYQTDAAGQSEDMDDSFSSMGVALGLAIAFIFMILAAQFESYSEPFAIMLSLPLAVIGALFGLFLAGSDLSLISLIGIMMLMGLVTKNAILLIDFAKQRMQEAIPCNDALVVAARIRLRPILMTSVAMIFGMLPIALSIGPGAEARAPMAHVIIGGLITSTLLTLVVVPVVYSLICDWKARRSSGARQAAGPANFQEPVNGTHYRHPK
ncbi:efflux RND transporter permease subunit [Propionispora hippei]|uniref:Hydrophobic/amphiphilic exporter-1, HAE1 family n=1 Tax=Propionispora hippei DSM 15287 TaxID=1123003 RepID=A0A1M6NFW2_9FIRM|nr:efflux RND transporter permease subunit [Propionispora hippei]SHJ94590.1 hydrophobic/amphiphilic exporter-1, HAE1 family [Propionispora hippei DSM 15287]